MSHEHIVCPNHHKRGIMECCICKGFEGCNDEDEFIDRKVKEVRKHLEIERLQRHPEYYKDDEDRNG